jgi:hypothetical protein
LWSQDDHWAGQIARSASTLPPSSPQLASFVAPANRPR